MRHGMVLGVGMVAVTIMVGCGADHADQIVDLQKQIALLSRQVEESRKDLHILQETDKNLKQSLDATDAELSRLAALESLPATVAKEKAEKVMLPTVADGLPPTHVLPTGRQKAKSLMEPTQTALVSCSQVWGLLGKGKPVTQVARALHTTPEKIKSCEQQVGRGGGTKTNSEFGG